MTWLRLAITLPLLAWQLWQCYGLIGVVQGPGVRGVFIVMFWIFVALAVQLGDVRRRTGTV